MFSIIGKNVVVCGGFGGIGQAICKNCQEKGVANLVILDLKEDENLLKIWQTKFPEQMVRFVPIDVTNKSVVESAIKIVVDNIERIDVFINCFGTLGDGNAALTIQVNLLGVIFTSLSALNYMGRHKGGNGGLIINLASAIGLEPNGAFAIYSASKHGVVGFTRSMADNYHYDRTGTRFIVICPGITDTSMITRFPFSRVVNYEDVAVPRAPSNIQSAETCGKNIVKIIENDPDNGSIWIVDMGDIEKVKPNILWTPKY